MADAEKHRQEQAKFDPAIMAELLAQPEVAVQAAKMPPVMLEWYKDLLIKDGIYSRYVKERKGEN